MTAPLHPVTHQRSVSTSGSVGRATSGRERQNTAQELGRYTEEEDEDYDDIFGKPNGSSEFREYGLIWSSLDTSRSGRS